MACSGLGLVVREDELGRAVHRHVHDADGSVRQVRRVSLRRRRTAQSTQIAADHLAVRDEDEGLSIFDNQAALVDHACKEIGDEAKISFMYGTYPDEIADPSRYNLAVAHSFYPGDSVGTTASEWDAWQHNGPTPFISCGGQPPMPTIGYNDGIAAAVNRLRDMDPKGTLLVKGADGKWPPLSSLPADITKWKAYDKFQRTVQILKDDHDAGEV
jgi:hypothetical protein